MKIPENIEKLLNKTSLKYVILISAMIGAPQVKELAIYTMDWYERNFQKKLTPVGKTIIGKFFIKDTIQKLERYTSAQRVLVLRGHNHGAPTVGKKFWSTVIEEAFDENKLKAVGPLWKNEPLDMAYLKMLIFVYQNGSHENVFSEMKSGSLKDMYENAGIKRSIVHLLHETPADFYYLSITFKTTKKLTSDERIRIRSSVTTLKNIYSGDFEPPERFQSMKRSPGVFRDERKQK